jgi:hypothetical protein
MNHLKLFNILAFALLSAATLLASACGKEGTVYGIINESYVEMKDSVTAISTLYDPYSGTNGYSQTVYGSNSYSQLSDLIITVGDGSEGFVVQITVNDIYSITCGYSSPLGYNISMELVMSDGTRYLATDGQILFDYCGMYAGEWIGGTFQAYFTSGELFGEFDTKIGY